MADILNATQQELMGTYLGTESRVYNPIWQLFGAVNSPYYGLSDKLMVEEMALELVQAGIVPRDTPLPAITVDGYTQTAITPEILGGKDPLSALDTIQKDMGVAIVNGQIVDNTKYTLQRKLSRLKSGIGNTLGAMAAELFFNGTFTTPKSGKTINFSLPAATTKADGDVGSYVQYISELVATFFAEKGYVPSVMIGSKIQKELIAEINASTGKKDKMNYKMEKIGKNGFRLTVDTMGLEIDIFPLMKKYDGTVIDTTTRIQLYAPEALLQAYAGLEFKGADGQPKLIRGEVFVDMLEADKETGRGSVFVKSAGVPFIVNSELIQRINVTFA